MSSEWPPDPRDRRRCDPPSGGSHRRADVATPPFGIEPGGGGRDDYAEPWPGRPPESGRHSRGRHGGGQPDEGHGDLAAGRPSYDRLAFGPRGYDIPIYGGPVQDAAPHRRAGYNDAADRGPGPGGGAPAHGGHGYASPVGGGALAYSADGYGGARRGGAPAYGGDQHGGPGGGGAGASAGIYGAPVADAPVAGAPVQEERRIAPPRYGSPGRHGHRSEPPGYADAGPGAPVTGAPRYGGDHGDPPGSRSSRHRADALARPPTYQAPPGAVLRPTPGFRPKPTTGLRPQPPPRSARQAPPGFGSAGGGTGSAAAAGWSQRPGNGHRSPDGYRGETGPRTGNGHRSPDGYLDRDGLASRAFVPHQPGPVSAPFAVPPPAAPGQRHDRGPDAFRGLRPGSRGARTATPSGRRGSRTWSTDRLTGEASGRTRRLSGRATPVIAPATSRNGRTAPARDRTGARSRRGRARRWLWLGTGLAVITGLVLGVVALTSSGPDGPAHYLVTPTRLGSFLRSSELARQMGVGQLERDIVAQSSGQASHLVSAVYQIGSPVPGVQDSSVLLFIGGRLSGASPASSIKSFIQHFRGAQLTNPGPLGGAAACVSGRSGGTDGSTVCAWFDNDTFGELVSPNMTVGALAMELRDIRPSVERVAR